MIILNDTNFLLLYLELGVSSTAIDTRPKYDGYTYKENEYCSEKTYGNATTMDEAISQCNDDPNCAAIEDRWGSGKPPIGLCTKYNGKRAGAGTYLLRRGNYQF